MPKCRLYGKGGIHHLAEASDSVAVTLADGTKLEIWGDGEIGVYSEIVNDPIRTGYAAKMYQVTPDQAIVDSYEIAKVGGEK